MLSCLVVLASYIAVFMVGLRIGATKSVKHRFRFMWYICVYLVMFDYAILHWRDFVQESASIGNLILLGFFLALTALPFVSKIKIWQVEGEFCDMFGEYVVQRQGIEEMSKSGSNNESKVKKDQEELMKEIERVA